MNRLLVIPVIIFFVVSGLSSARVQGEDLSTAEEGRRMGHLFDLYMTESFVLLRDEGLHNKIGEIVDKIVKVTEKGDDTFLLRIMNDPLPIATSYPGYVYVSSGMLDTIEHKDELAALIAHSLAHSIQGDQHQMYVDALRSVRISNLTGQIMPFLVFSGIGVVAVASGGVAAAASAIEGIALMESGFLPLTTLTEALTDIDIDKQRVMHNRLVPYVSLPDVKAKLSVLVFFGDIYGGYGKDKEIGADNKAIQYLDKAGYDAKVMVTVLRKLKDARKEYIARGYVSHVFLAKPGLEERIANAGHVFENHQ